MEWSVGGLVLLAAVLHAGWNALVKVTGDRLVVMAVITTGSGLIALAGLPFVALPDRASWPFLAASVVLHIGYNLFLVRAYRHGDLGQVYPIARGSAPLLVLALAYFAAGERVSALDLAAVVVIAVGLGSLAFRAGMPSIHDRATLAYAFGTALFIAGYTVVDGMGARQAGSAHGYALWLFVLDGIPITVIAIALRGRAFARSVTAHWRAGLAGGAMSLAAYWLVIWAMTVAPMALVAALRETSVVFAALIAAVILKEGFGPRRIAAAALVAAGVVLLRL